MGSGLILLVIVGAWLAVLVPMGLRSHDTSASTSTERFGDAMRVLSRRPAAGAAPEPAGRRRGGRAAGSVRMAAAGLAAVRTAGRPVLRSVSTRLRPSRPGSGRPGSVRATFGPGSARTGGSGSVRVAMSRPHGHPASAAVRRRRVLAGLLASFVLLLLAGLVGPHLLLIAAVVAGVLLAVFAVACRRAAVARRRARRRAQEDRAYEDRAHEDALLREQSERDQDEVTQLIAALPNRLPDRRVAGVGPAAAAAASSAVRYDERPQHVRTGTGSRAVVGTGATGGSTGGDGWQPVPVPLPTYLDGRGAAPRRVVDLTQPGAWTAAQQPGAAQGSGAAQQAGAAQRPGVPQPVGAVPAPRPEDVGDGHEDAAPRRRAAGGW